MRIVSYFGSEEKGLLIYSNATILERESAVLCGLFFALWKAMTVWKKEVRRGLCMFSTRRVDFLPSEVSGSLSSYEIRFYSNWQ